MRLVKEMVRAPSTNQFERFRRVRAKHDLQGHVLLIGEVVDAQGSPSIRLAVREVLLEVLKVLVLDLRNGAHHDADHLRALGRGACLDGD